MLQRNKDTVRYFITNMSLWDRETHCFIRYDEAFDFWRHLDDRDDWEVVEVYAAEGRCTPLEDDWSEFVGEVETDEREMADYYRSLAVPSM